MKRTRDSDEDEDGEGKSLVHEKTMMLTPDNANNFKKLFFFFFLLFLLFLLLSLFIATGKSSFMARALSDYPTARPLHGECELVGTTYGRCCFFVFSFFNLSLSLARPPDKSRIRVFVIRHGESIANVDPSRLLELSDHMITLSDEGRQQAKQAGGFLKDYLGVDVRPRIYVSPYKRARDTADLIVEAGGTFFLFIF
jgi:hypothetical protein